jgi:TatA/E family protein of Tat protein translocase
MPLPSGFEWIVILVIALLILGPGKLPDVAAAVGKSLREFRKATSDVQDAVKVETSPLPAGPAQVTQATQQAQPAPNVLQTSAEPNTLQQPTAPIAPVETSAPPVAAAPQPPIPVADASPTDAAPTANG